MEYLLHSFGYVYEIISSEYRIKPLWLEIIEGIESITDEEIINHFNEQKRKAKSISETLNQLIKEKLIEKQWRQESLFLIAVSIENRVLELDFAKELSVELLLIMEKL